MKFNLSKCKSLLVAVILFGLTLPVAGQIEYPGNPAEVHSDEKQLIHFIELPSAEILHKQFIDNRQEEERYYKKDVFASAIEVDISPSTDGNWYEGEKNCSIWQLGITALHASSLSLIFDAYHLLPGCRLFIYSPDRKLIYGAFTFRNNKLSKVFAISPVENDSLIIELQMENSIKEFGELTLLKVGVGFPREKIFKNTNDEYYGWSAACHLDVNCDLSEHVQRQKHSVCRIIYNGTTRCTGTLINNSKENGRPLILTAGHCISNNNEAESAVYFFDYESPYCNGPDGKSKSISGSSLLSVGNGLDFSLTEMSEIPPLDYKPLYAGWDVRELSYDNVYSMHHPEGDVKKITTDSDILQLGTFHPFDSETHWLISKYDTGSTEAGSSGAALFSSENKVIGTLSGGNDVCTEYIYDYYQMMIHSWADYPNEREQLKAWLDPGNSGKITLDSYAPLDPLFSVSEELSNTTPGEKDTLIKGTLNWGYISGHNHLQTKEFAERFSFNGTKYVYAVSMNISKLNFTLPYSKIKIKLWNDQAYPNDLVFEKDLYYFEMIEGENFIRLDTILYVNQCFYMGYEIDYSYSEDTFAVSTSLPGTDINSNTAFYKGEGKWLPLTDGNQSFSTSLSIWPVAMNYNPPDKLKPEEFPVKEVTLYPNPTYGNLQVLFKSEPAENVDLNVYDCGGRLVLKLTKQSPEPNFLLTTDQLNQGVYLLRIIYGSKETTLKFVKL